MDNVIYEIDEKLNEYLVTLFAPMKYDMYITILECLSILCPIADAEVGELEDLLLEEGGTVLDDTEFEIEATGIIKEFVNGVLLAIGIVPEEHMTMTDLTKLLISIKQLVDLDTEHKEILEEILSNGGEEDPLFNAMRMLTNIDILDYHNTVKDYNIGLFITSMLNNFVKPEVMNDLIVSLTKISPAIVDTFPVKLLEDNIRYNDSYDYIIDFYRECNIQEPQQVVLNIVAMLYLGANREDYYEMYEDIDLTKLDTIDDVDDVIADFINSEVERYIGLMKNL